MCVGTKTEQVTDAGGEKGGSGVTAVFWLPASPRRRGGQGSNGEI